MLKLKACQLLKLEDVGEVLLGGLLTREIVVGWRGLGNVGDGVMKVPLVLQTNFVYAFASSVRFSSTGVQNLHNQGHLHNPITYVSLWVARGIRD